MAVEGWCARQPPRRTLTYLRWGGAAGLSAVGSLEVPGVADPTSGSGAGRLVAGTVRLSGLESSLAFLLPAMCCDDVREDWASLPAPEMVAWLLMSATQVVLVLLDAAAFVLFFAATAFLSSRRRAGENCSVEIALRKASAFCFSITLQQGAASQSRAILPRAPLYKTNITWKTNLTLTEYN